MKKRCLIALSVVSLIMPSSLGMLGKTVAAKGFNKDGTLPITEENFPDRVFRQIIVSAIFIIYANIILT